MNVVDSKTTKEKAEACLWGVFIGDALGLPVECKSPSEIKNNFGYVDQFVHNGMHNYENIASLPPGSWSDDTQLSLAMMHSLSNEYDINEIKKSHVLALKGNWLDPVGWGKSTREACKKLSNNINDTNTASINGAGNGPLIKIAPLAIYGHVKASSTQLGKFTNSFNESLLKKCKEISSLTHDNDMCIVAAYAHARMIVRALQDELPLNEMEIAELVIEDSVKAEHKLGAETNISNRLRDVLTADNFKINTANISEKLCTEKSSYVFNSYPLVAYCCAKYLPYKNFRLAILETVNAGADADSNASMVGAVMGAFLGAKSKWQPWSEKIKHSVMLKFNINKFLSRIYK